MPMSESRILVMGEALTDIVLREHAEPVEHPGGSPMNVAVGLSRLGISAVFHTSVGRDDRGAAIEGHLAASGVALTAESANASSTSTAKVVIGPSGAAEYDFDVRWAPADGVRAGGGMVAVHTGSIAAVMEPGATEVRAIVEAARASCTISYDPNVRPALMGSPSTAAPAIEAMVRLSDVVKASDEDLEWLYPGRDPLDSAREWARTGPGLVIVTRGASGAWAVSLASVTEVPAQKVEVVDTIGAGDSFMAGLLAALADRQLLGAGSREALAAMDSAALQRVVSFAIGCAAITITRAGADPPTRAQLTSSKLS